VPNLMRLMQPLEADVISAHLVLLFASNDLISVGAYLLAERHQTPVIMVNSEVPLSSKKELISKYRPSLVVSSLYFDLDLSIQKRSIINDLEEDLFLWKTDFNVKTNPELMLMLSTSGSTGSPKLVRLSRDNVYSNSASILNYLPIQHSDTCLLNLSISYSYGLSILNSHLLADASIFLTSETFLSRKLWNKIEEFQINSIAGVPEMIKMLKLIKLEKMTEILHNLKYVTQAGGNLDLDHRITFSNMFKANSIDFFIMYGQTEATARMSFLSPKYMPSKLKSVGLAVSGGEFEIVQGENTLKNCIEGEIVYRGPNVMLGYAENHKDLELGNCMNNVLYTGDLGYKDEDGFLYITGRKKRIIKINGGRFSLDHLEEILMSNGAQTACVASENRILIFIRSMKVADIVRTSLRNLGVGKTQYTVNILNDFPLNANGKVDYFKLKENVNV
jgi:long-chain acyl-CoA synthetase